MIPVRPQPEPLHFDQMVRVPGNTFLRDNPHPKKWKEYWRVVLIDLWAAYGGVCAYTCHWIPFDTGADTVEHFVPKSINPSTAYEWSNYRLVCARLNGRKGNHQDVLDPFTLGKEWFILEFPALLVKPNPNLAEDDKQAVLATRDRLKLNDERCIKARLDWIKPFCLGQFNFEYLKDKAPFIAYELERQNLISSIGTIFNFPK